MVRSEIKSSRNFINSIITRFEVFTEMKVQVDVFCVVIPCGLVVGYRRFGGPCCLRLEGENGGGKCKVVPVL
jgi:hypothetical protein